MNYRYSDLLDDTGENFFANISRLPVNRQGPTSSANQLTREQYVPPGMEYLFTGSLPPPRRRRHGTLCHHLPRLTQRRLKESSGDICSA